MTAGAALASTAARTAGHVEAMNALSVAWMLILKDNQRDPAHRRTGTQGLAATTDRCGRWQCWPTAGWSPAGTTGGRWCDPARPGILQAELGRHHGSVQAVAVLADGRVVTGGYDGRVLAWDPAHRPCG